MAAPPPFRAPGVDAPARPRKSDVRDVREVLGQIAEQAARLPDPYLKELVPVLAQAQKELREDLRAWLAKHKDDGDLRFTAQQYRSALAQMKGVFKVIEGRVPKELQAILRAASADAGEQALDGLEKGIARMAAVFGHSVRPIQLPQAAILAQVENALIPRFRNSANRYAGGISDDIRRQLAVGVARGETFSQMTNRLVRMGGPRGWVALRGTLGEPGSYAEFIAEGLFRRYRGFAERVVVTETLNSYNAHSLEGLRAANEEDPGYLGEWDARLDRSCPVCQELDGKRVELGKGFAIRDGRVVRHPPLHPRCSCCIIPYREEWDEAVTVRTKTIPKPPPPKPQPERPAKPAEGSLRAPWGQTASLFGFDPKAVASALGGSGVDASARAELGKMFSGMGLTDHAAKLKRGQEIFSEDKLAGGARGFLGWDGLLSINQEVRSGSERFFRKLGASHKFNPRDLEDRRAVSSARTLIHESMHGHGPIAGRPENYVGYDSPAARVEEVSTELTARKIMREQLGLPAAKWDPGKPETAYTGFPVGPRGPSHAAPYQRLIDQMIDDVAAAGGMRDDAAIEAVERASIGLKKRNPATINGQDDMVRAFAEETGLPREKQAALVSKIMERGGLGFSEETKTEMRKAIRAAETRTFRQFTDPKESKKWMEKSFKKANKGMSADERDAVDIYQGMDYRSINGHLRGDDRYGADMQLWSNKRGGVVIMKDIVADLDRAIARSEVPEDIILYRGTTKIMVGQNAAQSAADLVPGMKIDADPAFQSTSTNRTITEGFAEQGRGWLLEIEAPRGTKGLYANVKHGLDKENEIILPRGVGYRVVSVRIDQTKYGDPLKIARVQIVDPED